MPAKMTDATSLRRTTKLDPDFLVILGISLLGVALAAVMLPLLNGEVVTVLTFAG